MDSPVIVHMLPRFVEPHALRGTVAVVIDVLRASTTIVHALANGAAAVVPCQTVEEALALKAVLEGSAATKARPDVLLGGERHGKRIDGFDLDNSPLAYTEGSVSGRTIVFTTTNGTRALAACREADRVLVGAFVNRSALVRVLKEDGRPVHLVCAGTDGHLTAEDILFAGAVSADLLDSAPADAAWQIDVQTQMALDYYRARSAATGGIRETLRSSRGGSNLLQLGMDADIDRAAQVDLFDVVPEWNPAENRIVPVGRT